MAEMTSDDWAEAFVRGGMNLAVASDERADFLAFLRRVEPELWKHADLRGLADEAHQLIHRITETDAEGLADPPDPIIELVRDIMRKREASQSVTGDAAENPSSSDEKAAP